METLRRGTKTPVKYYKGINVSPNAIIMHHWMWYNTEVCVIVFSVFSGVSRRTSTQRVHWWGTSHTDMQACTQIYTKISISTVMKKTFKHIKAEDFVISGITSNQVRMTDWACCITFSWRGQECCKENWSRKCHRPVQDPINNHVLFCTIPFGGGPVCCVLSWTLSCSTLFHITYQIIHAGLSCRPSVCYKPGKA